MRPLVAPLSLVLLLLLAQCTKIKTTDLGADLIPAVDRINTFDTLLPVVTDNLLLSDSALPLIGKDFSGRASEHVLGAITADPLFGQTTASIFLELKPPTYKFYFENVPDSLSLDSVVLCLKWNRTWGDTLAQQAFDVFRLDQGIRRDTSYSTNADFPYTRRLGTRSIIPRALNDSVPVLTYKIARQLRIRLSDDFGRELLRQDSADGRPFASDSLFRDYLKGFAVVPQTTGAGAAANALLGFALSDTNTYLGIYYKVVRNGKTDTLARKFPFDNPLLSGSANRIARNRKGSEMEKYTAPSATGDSLVFLQVTPGSYAQVSIPALDAFRAAKGNVIVHLAELVAGEVAQAPPASPLSPPILLYADYFDTAFKARVPFGPDGFPTGSYDPSFLGGLRKTAAGPGAIPYTSYGIYITRHVQSILTRGRPNPPIALYAPYLVSYPSLNLAFGVNPLAAGRVRLGGGSHSRQPMRLRVVYTRI
jgi:hypothetical protein